MSKFFAEPDWDDVQTSWTVRDADGSWVELDFDPREIGWRG